ncbi:phosphoribosyltransferase [Aeromonas salmonicida]|uniref:phosphoribosyltransferase n=1 Tax=Aeromonas salmonicida TaxID=645 RepID=UPI00259EA6BD|nr:phosphoribosyltransferase [Aeromonas salmonicida]MDM5128629.1 phosphoribosyltransferase [Aeromonas salmonicida]
MMDFKNPDCHGHQRSITYFGKMLIDKVEQFNRRGSSGQLIPLLDSSVQIAIVPSHKMNRISPALIAIAEMVAVKYNKTVIFQPLLRRTVDVLSAHKDNGDRSIEHHMRTIRVVTDNLRPNMPVFLIDDVTTSGGSMSACYHLLEQAGASEIYPIALLETSYS